MARIEAQCLPLALCARPAESNSSRHSLPAPPARLLCSGVAEMAEELYGVLHPHMEGHSRLHLAGHSLGGSLATMVALTAHLRLGGSNSSSSSNSRRHPQARLQARAVAVHTCSPCKPAPCGMRSTAD